MFEKKELAIAAAAGVAAAFLFKAITASDKHHSIETTKTKKSPIKLKGFETYETGELVAQYLNFHYATPSEVLGYDFGPSDALEFPLRIADECIRQAKEHAPNVTSRALDIGCAVGRSSFELTKHFDSVHGIDFSHAFIATCIHLKTAKHMEYTIQEEGALRASLVARVDSSLDVSKAHFSQGDACNLPESLGQFGLVLAANLICRLPTPLSFLNRCRTLIVKGGLLVITTPYTWLEDYTPKELWLGGNVDKEGRRVTGFEALKAQLEPDFELLASQQFPFFIRETARKNQWTVAHCTVWRRT